MATFIDKTLQNYDGAVEDFVNRYIEQEGSYYHSDLKDFATHAHEVKEQTSQKLMDYKDSFLRGYKYVLENGPKFIENVSKEQFILEPAQPQDTNKNLPERQLEKILNASKPLQEICGYTSEMMTGIYKMGLDLYKSKDYQSSIDLFTFLVTLNPYICWFWQMLGKSYQAQQSFIESLYAFEVAINCNVFNFEGYLDAVRCCVQAKESNEALRIVDFGIHAIDTSENPKQFETLKKDLESLKKQLNQTA